MKLLDLCARLEVDYDEARYTLARQVLPKGVKKKPGKGRHRLFEYHQAFHLAIILKLKAAGVATPMAAEISKWAPYVEGLSVRDGWDPEFAPFKGRCSTKHQWFIEVADGRFVRLATDANPGTPDLYVTCWVDMKSRKEVASVRPTVMFRVDMVHISQLLMDSAGLPPME